MSTTYAWSIVGLNVEAVGEQTTTTASWVLTGTSSTTYDFYIPGTATTIPANFTGSQSGNTVVNITITPATTEALVIAALEAALGEDEIIALETSIQDSIDASIISVGQTTNYGPSGQPLPWNVPPG